MSALAGSATGMGSWPGTDPREAAAIVVGELPGLPHLVELPARGVGADMIGRAGALLVDIRLDTTTRGYRVTTARSNAARRAASLLREDLDALEEAWETAGLTGSGVVKLQVAGPVTMAAELELAGGHRALTDMGATRDLAASLAEGVAAYRAEVAKRLGAQVVLQLDEPSLPAVLAGSLAGVTGVDTVRALPAPDALALLNGVLAVVGEGVALHCCAANVPWELLRRSAIDAVALDATTLDARDLDGIGELLEAGKDLILGLIPTAAPASAPRWREAAAPALALVDRLGFSRDVLRTRVGVSPTCGLAGASPTWAREALRLAREVTASFVDGEFEG